LGGWEGGRGGGSDSPWDFFCGVLFVQWMRSIAFVNPNLLQQVYNLWLFVGMVGISDIREESWRRRRRRGGVGKVLLGW